jgi:hypothetical protein
MRQRKLAQTLDKAAKAVQQRQIDEHGNRNARIDEWLTNQDLPRALPVLKPLPLSPSSTLTASTVGKTFRNGTDLKSSSDLQQSQSTAMAMKIGALPHSQWHVQRGGSFTTAHSTRDALSSAPQSPAVGPRLPPSLPPLPSHLQPHKK